MGHIQSLDDLIGFLLRRKWLILAVTVIGMVLASVYAKSRPPTYEAAAVIKVEAPQVDQITATGGQLPPQSLSEVLQSVEQRLTARDNMLAVVERHGLFAGGLTPDQKIALLRRSVTFDTVASAGAQGFGSGAGVSAMIISVRLGDAEQAARVANDFAQGLLDEGNAAQAARAKQTLAFYQEETRRIETEIATLEAEAAAYRNTHSGNMPTMRGARSEELSGLDSDLRDIERDLAGLNGQRALLEQGGVTRATDRRQLQDLSAQISVAGAQRDSLLARRAEVEASLTSSAEVDRALAGYDRRAVQLQAQYELASRNMAEAETAARLTERRQTERISLLERALTPEYPVSGGAKKLAIAGTLASLIGGVALAFVLEMLRPVVRTAEQMERELDLRPVVSIPEVDRRAAMRGGKAPGRKDGGSGGGGAGGGTSRLMRLFDDPSRPVLGLPRYAVVAAGAATILVLAAAVIG